MNNNKAFNDIFNSTTVTNVVEHFSDYNYTSSRNYQEERQFLTKTEKASSHADCCVNQDHLCSIKDHK